jgi:hypothetical protein
VGDAGHMLRRTHASLHRSRWCPGEYYMLHAYAFSAAPHSASDSHGSVLLLVSGTRSTSRAAALLHWPQHIQRICHSQLSARSRQPKVVCAAGGNRAASDTADAAAGANLAPDTGLRDAGPESYPLADTLPGECIVHLSMLQSYYLTANG